MITCLVGIVFGIVALFNLEWHLIVHLYRLYYVPTSDKDDENKLSADAVVPTDIVATGPEAEDSTSAVSSSTRDNDQTNVAVVATGHETQSLVVCDCNSRAS